MTPPTIWISSITASPNPCAVRRKRVLHVRVGLAGVGVETRCSPRPELAGLLDQLFAKKGRQRDDRVALVGNDGIALQPPGARTACVAAAELGQLRFGQGEHPLPDRLACGLDGSASDVSLA